MKEKRKIRKGCKGLIFTSIIFCLVCTVKADSSYHLIPRDELIIDTNVIYGPAIGNQNSPSIAFDGKNYFIVWVDNRYETYQIYGARVDLSGRLLDTVGISIGVLSSKQTPPSIAFDGENFLLVWQKRHSYPAPDTGDIYGTLITPEGKILKGDIPISIAEEAQTLSKIAFDGTNYLVVWEDRRNENEYVDIYGTRVTPEGIVLDTAGIPISTALYSQWTPAVVFDGINYFVVWEDFYQDDICGTWVSKEGKVLDSVGIRISMGDGGERSPSVAFDGKIYLVVWQGKGNIYGSRVTRDGEVLDPEGIPISTAYYLQQDPKVIFDGVNYFVVWIDRREDYRSHIYGARITPEGEVLDPEGIPVCTAKLYQSYPSVCFNGTNYFIVWGDTRNKCHSDIYGVHLSREGIVLDTNDILISVSANPQITPSAAFDGINYFVVWQNWSGNSWDINGVRLDPSGKVLEPAGISITTFPYEQTPPRLIFGSENYLLVWEESYGETLTDIYGVRISRQGEILDRKAIPISVVDYDQANPSIAFDGTNYLMVWEDTRSGWSKSHIYGARVNKNGEVLDPDGLPLITTQMGGFFPAIAFDGKNYFVVWWKEYGSFGWETNNFIYGARINPQGEVLDSSSCVICSTLTSYFGAPSIAFDGRNYLVAWRDWRRGLCGSFVTTSGAVLDSGGFVICPANFEYFPPPSLAFDGENYIIVWEDTLSRLHGVVFTPSEEVIDSFEVSSRPRDQTSPVLVKGPGNQVLIVYSGWTEEINGDPVKAMRIWGKLYPTPGIEEKNARHRIQNTVLRQNYPNPFHSSTEISYVFTKGGLVSFKVYNVNGQCVRTLICEKQPAGNYKIIWDGKNDEDRKVPAGVYFYCLKTGGSTQIKKMILLK